MQTDPRKRRNRLMDRLAELGTPHAGQAMPFQEFAASYPASEPRKPSLLERLGEVTQTDAYQGAGVSYYPRQAPADAAVSFASRLPVAGEMVDAYDLATAVRDRKPVQGALAALSLALPFVGMAAMKRGAGDAADAVSDALPAPKQPIRAFHGSPHDFDKFDLSKIGTGEGAQAYGHGLYFAENMDVAKSYQPRNLKAEAAMLRAYQRAEKVADYPAMEAWERAMMHETPAEIRAYAMSELADDPAYRGAFMKVADELDKMPRAGSLVEVAIHADPEDFLDYDAPLSAQSPKVRSALESVLGPIGGDYEGRTGKSWLYDVGATADPVGNPYVAATETLRPKGVAGVRYFDGMSRTAGEGTRNYVLFDDSLVEILRKYGLAALTAGGLGLRPLLAEQETR